MGGVLKVPTVRRDGSTRESNGCLLSSVVHGVAWTESNI